MPFKYRDFGKKTKTATLDLGEGDSIAFEFRTGVMTPQFLADFQSLSDAALVTPAVLLALSKHLANLLVSWDMLDDDGVSMFPLTPERLVADIPAEAQVSIIFAAIGEMRAAQTGEAPAAAS
jgi:hypothetical protein